MGPLRKAGSRRGDRHHSERIRLRSVELRVEKEICQDIS
jgi:hypothetical protein